MKKHLFALQYTAVGVKWKHNIQEKILLTKTRYWQVASEFYSVGFNYFKNGLSKNDFQGLLLM